MSQESIYPREPMNPIGFLLFAAGAFCIVGAAMDWDWFMNSRKAQLFVTLFGRNGARVCYYVLGAVIIVLGLGIAFGLIQDSN